MATIKKPVIIAKPALLTASVKTTTTTPIAKKPSKPDTVRKMPTAATKMTHTFDKTPSKQVVSKMASTKVSAVAVDKSASSLKPLPAKSNVTSPSKPVAATTLVKRVVADSTSCDKEPVARPVRKLSIPTGLTKSTKVGTKVTTIGSLTTGAKPKTTFTSNDKVSAKPMAEKLSAKAKLTSSTLPSKTNATSIKPVTTSALVKRPQTLKMVDIKKSVVSRTVLAKSISKTATSVVKPPSIRTPLVDKKVKKCTEVQICDADSTSLTINDQLEIELGFEFGTVAPRETSVEINESQFYRVAQQMMETLGSKAVMMNETIHHESLLKDSEKMAPDEQIFEYCAEDETREDEKCDNFEMSNNQGDLTKENEVGDENVYNYESSSVEAEKNDENTETEERGEVINERPSTADSKIPYKNEKDAVSPAEESQLEQPEKTSEKVVDSAISMDIWENHFCADSDPASVNLNSECNSDDFVVLEMGEENSDENPEQVLLFVDDGSVRDTEKSADTESVGNADSAVSYADVVKQSATKSAGDLESFGNAEILDLKAETENSSSQQTVFNTDGFSTEIMVNEEDVAVTEVEADSETIQAAEDTETSKVAGDVEVTEASEDVKASEATDVETNSVEETTLKVEPLLGSMTDEVQQELDAGMEHSHVVDEEGYMEVQKKRNKKHNKRHRKSLKALQKENADFEPVTEVQESQDDLQVFQKRRNFRRTKNSMKKQYRRYSEPYSNFHCYSIPVWRSYYVEH